MIACGARASQDLAATADLFGRLATDDLTDSAAWYNRALCLAWMGKNLEAIGCLDRVVGLEAERAFDLAVDAWTLAEVLRQGGGAEIARRRPALRLHHAPGTRAIRRGCSKSFPKSSASPRPARQGPRRTTFLRSRCSSGSIGRSRASLISPPRRRRCRRSVLASVYIGSQTLRLSSPRVENLERIEEALFPRLENGAGSVRREASPLPLPFLDADVWIFRDPAWS